jgi:flagellar basal-body rod protein FlgC
MPNVDTTEEMIEMLSATRAYEANATVMDATKSMFQKAMEIMK